MRKSDPLWLPVAVMYILCVYMCVFLKQKPHSEICFIFIKFQHQLVGIDASQGQTTQKAKLVVITGEGPNLPKHNKMLLRETLRALVHFAVLQAAQNKPSLTLSLGR